MLLAALLLPAMGLASGAGFGPSLPMSAIPAAGEDMAWKLLEDAKAAKSLQAGTDLVMKAATAAPESGLVQLRCANMLMEMDADSRYLPEAERFARRAVSLLKGPDQAEALCLLAGALLQSGQMDEAARAMEQATALAPQNEVLKLLMARTLCFAGRNEDALNALESLAEDSPRNFDALYLRAMILLAECRWEEALQAYRQIDYGWPEYVEGKAGQYQTYVASGQFDRALRMVDQLILCTGDDAYWLERARLRLWKMFDPEAALADAGALLRANQAWTDALVVKMASCLMLEQYAEADATAAEIEALDAEYGMLMHGMVTIEQGRWADAITVFTALTEKNPDQFLSWEYIGMALLNGYDDINGAREATAKAFACEGAREDYGLFIRLGNLYRREGDQLEAARAFAQADRLVEDDPLPLYFLVVTCAEAGRAEDMLDMVKEMERRYPGWYETMLARLLLEDALGRTQEALAAFEKLKEKFPHRAKGLVDLEGKARASAGQPEGAEMIQRWMNERETADVRALNAYAFALMELGEYGEAREALETARSLVPEGDPERAGEAREARIDIAVTQAELALQEGDMDACIAALARIANEGWPLTCMAIHPMFEALYASDAFQALLGSQAPRADEWNLSVLPAIPQ